MARILICEQSPAIAELFEHVLRLAGHEPVAFDARADDVPDVDLILLEPSTPGGLDCVAAARRRRQDLPLVCASIYPKSEEVARLAPAAYLLKPFKLAELEQAVAAAVASRP